MIEQGTSSLKKGTNIHSPLQRGSSRGRDSGVASGGGLLARFRQLPLWRPLLLPLFRRLWAGEAVSLLAD